MGKKYLVIVDRYLNWPIVEQANKGDSGLIKALRQCFATWGSPEQLTSDGGPEFTSTITQSFLHTWDYVTECLL